MHIYQVSFLMHLIILCSHWNEVQWTFPNAAVLHLLSLGKCKKCCYHGMSFLGSSLFYGLLLVGQIAPQPLLCLMSQGEEEDVCGRCFCWGSIVVRVSSATKAPQGSRGLSWSLSLTYLHNVFAVISERGENHTKGVLLREKSGI